MEIGGVLVILFIVVVLFSKSGGAVESPTPKARSREQAVKQTMWREDYLPDGAEVAAFALGSDGMPDLKLVSRYDWWVLTTRSGEQINPKSRSLYKVGIFVFRARGTAYREAAGRIADTRPGRPIVLRRDRDNPHDPNAIEVQAAKARQHESPLTIGFVNRQNAARMAKRMDAGGTFEAIFVRGAQPGTEEVPWVLACSPALMKKLGRPTS